MSKSCPPSQPASSRQQSHGSAPADTRLHRWIRILRDRRLSCLAAFGVFFFVWSHTTLAFSRGGSAASGRLGWLTDDDAKYSARPAGEDADAHAREAFQWEDVTPSTSLQYTPCFSSFQCARLSVPLNWNATLEQQRGGPRATVAIIKLPAKVPVTDARYGGPIIINPGGPGESGVFQALTDGHNLQTVLDYSGQPAVGGLDAVDAKYFDILSFDPRGVNNTRPQLRCFADSADQHAWLLSLPDYGILWSSESVTGMEWARAEALGASCSYGEDDSGILKHANTAQTVEDMVRIIESEGEWRANEAERLLNAAEGEDAASAERILERTAYRPGQEKLKYWGMSYGTLLGSTFAALHPDRVGRMVIDGVVDPADHYAGTWLTQLQDSDTIISKFCQYCFEAGPERCPLSVGSSPDDVESHLTSVLLHLKANPIAIPPVPEGGNTWPGLVTYGDAHLALLSAMYFPFAMAESFFDLLHAIHGRNASSPVLRRIVDAKAVQRAKAPCEGRRESVLDPCITYVSGYGAFQAISCMDIGGPTNVTREGFMEYLSELRSQGRWISTSWARNKLACLGYTVQPAWRPDLTFKSQEWANTSHPLLIIGNTHDTVTPLRNARRVSTLFPGSVVLHQDSQGHCSHSTPSLCTAQTVRRYFQTGQLPQEGTVCQPEVRPFVGCVGGVEDDITGCKFIDGEEARLYQAMTELADPFGLRPKDTGEVFYGMSPRLPMM